MFLKRTKLLLVIIALVGAISVPTGAVFASSGPAMISDRVSHITLVDDTTPVIIEREEFLFEIPTFDSGKLTATYNMYNPTEEEVTLHCALPTDMRKDAVIKIGDDEVSTELRHMLANYGYDNAKYAHNIKDDYITDIFYSPDLKVTKYTYRIEGAEQGTVVTWTLKALTRNTEFVANANCIGVTKDSASYGQWAIDGGEISFYVIGDDIAEPEFSFVDSFYSSNPMSGTAEKVAEEEMTFLDIAMLDYDEEGAISKVDWYNAVVTRLKDIVTLAHSEYEFYITDMITDCLVYSVTVGAGDRVVNKVELPLLPTYAYPDYKDECYRYVLDMAPASEWNIEEIECRLTTPYYLINSPDFVYDKESDAYIFNEYDVNYGKIYFSLSTASKLTYKWDVTVAKILVPIFVRFIGLPLCCAVVYGGSEAIDKKREKK